jgi:cytochrome c oxidase cbb3-type subunit 3
MSRHVLGHLSAAGLAAAALVIADQSLAQSNSPSQLQPSSEQRSNGGNLVNAMPPTDLRRVPMVNTTPGNVSPEANVKNPFASDPKSAERGMKYFIAFNCVGCHAANGGGGMGPALSDAALFKYGTDPATLFLVINHGAPLGMPAWGTVLPQNVIWDLVSYVESISKFPRPAWGNTVDASSHLPGIEQVPAEFKETANPWDYTEPFSNGQKPTEHPPTTSGGTTGSGNK